MGSRILSRSFIVEGWKKPEDDDDEDNDDDDLGTNVSLENVMDIDEPPTDLHELEEAEVEANQSLQQFAEDDSDSENEDTEDPGDVAMVPMADMLNARYQSENVGCSHRFERPQGY